MPRLYWKERDPLSGTTPFRPGGSSTERASVIFPPKCKLLGDRNWVLHTHSVTRCPVSKLRREADPGQAHSLVTWQLRGLGQIIHLASLNSNSNGVCLAEMVSLLSTTTHVKRFRWCLAHGPFGKCWIPVPAEASGLSWLYLSSFTNPSHPTPWL